MKAFSFHGEPPYSTNSFLLITEENHGVIIDPVCAPEEYESVLAKHGAALTTIFCTHGHFDHVGSAMALRDKHGAKLYCNPEDTLGDQMMPLPFADAGFTDNEEIQIDELTFTVWRTPGHTKGSVCILCDEFFFTGDTIFRGNIGRIDFPGGSGSDMRASCKRIRALNLPPKTAVLPGHEDFSSYGEEIAHNYYLVNAT